MKKVLILTLFGCAVLSGSAAGAAEAADAETERVLEGTYTAPNMGEDGPIRGVFKPTGETEGTPTWSVVFTVTFDTADYLYLGVVEGSLDEGEVYGEVENEAGSQQYMFRGEQKDGKLHAVHAETTDGFIRETGTMTLEDERQ